MDLDRGSVSDIDRVVRFLVDTARCRECGGSYSSEDVHVLDQVGRSVWELAAVCPECLSVWLVRAVVRGRGVPAPMPDDGPTGRGRREARADELTLAERLHFGALGPIGVDDVLDIRSFLSTFDGDFLTYFGQESDGPS